MAGTGPVTCLLLGNLHLKSKVTVEPITRFTGDGVSSEKLDLMKSSMVSAGSVWVQYPSCHCKKVKLITMASPVQFSNLAPPYGQTVLLQSLSLFSQSDTLNSDTALAAYISLLHTNIYNHLQCNVAALWKRNTAFRVSNRINTESCISL